MARTRTPMTVVIASTAVTIGRDDGSSIEVAPLWLREMCRCGECRYDNGRRRVEALQTAPDLMPRSIEIADGSLVIAWSDGHRGRVELADLPALEVRADVPEPISWGSEMNDAIPTFEHAAVLADPRVELEWIEAIERFGFAVVCGVPTHRAAMRELAESIGPVRASNYGPDWEIKAVVDPADAVVSGSGLSPHTDLPYRQLPPGLQFLLSVEADVEGGASTLVDSHRIADVFRADEPHHWITLTDTRVRFEFDDGDLDYRIDAPVLSLGPDHRPSVVRHAPGLLGTFDHRPARFEAIHAAMRRFTELTNDPAMQVVHRLEPGELLVFDNHRLLHGRQAFDPGAGGKRHLLGCYLDRDDLSSRARCLRAAAR